MALSVELLILAAAWAALGWGAWSLRLLEESTVQGLTAAALGLAALGVFALLLGALWSLRRGLGKARLLRAGSVAVGALSSGAAIAAGLLVVWRNTPAGHAAMLQLTRDTKPWVSTTLVVPESEVRALPPSDRAPRRLALLLRFTGELERGGARLLLGTDTGVPCQWPGPALHLELRELVKLGIEPLVALRSATSAPARFLDPAGSFGRVAPGQRADLLLVEGNPLEQPDALAHPRGVMVRGRWLTTQELPAAR